MGDNLWNFMASPNRAVAKQSDGRGKGKKSRRRETDVKLPWFVSLAVFLDVARVLLGTLLLLGLSGGAYGDVMPNWFLGLIIVHGLAMIATLVFILNGFGLARLALIALAVGQLWFDQSLITRYFLLIDALIIVVFFIGPSNRYFAACDQARHPDE
ncbi:MAG: hypothetical protein FWD80_01190 [Propionibacteriaceae bacterium]|nr:hypothetical protein [Propionibacteriaceae bacterium]